jgi:hypothetical protein
MMQFRVEHFESEEQATALFQKLMPLYDAHAKEIGMPSNGGDAAMAVGPGWQAGTIKLFTAQEGSQIVGYSMWSAGKSWMSKQDYVTMVGMYLEPSYRGTNGREFLGYCKQAFAIMGIKKILAIGDEGTGFDKWLRRQSTGVQQTVYVL